jgi:hypothetical protein
MMIATVLAVLATLLAGAAAGTPRENCIVSVSCMLSVCAHPDLTLCSFSLPITASQGVYADSFNAAGSREERCAAAHDLSLCFATTVTEHDEVVLAQGFLDATQFNEDCSEFEPTITEKVKLETADRSLRVGLGRGKDMVISRQQEPEIISIWSVNSKISTLAASAASKADFVSLQSTIARLKQAQGGIIDDIKSGLLEWVDSRLVNVENDIKTSLADALAELQAVANSIRTGFDDRVDTLEAQVSTITANVVSSIIAQIDTDNAALAASVNRIVTDTNAVSSRIDSVDSSINTKVSSAISTPKSTMDKLLAVFEKSPVMDAKLPVFRYNTWHTYTPYNGWYCDNNANMFGGVNPSTWTDGRAYASSLSADKNILRTLFNKKLNSGWNAVVQASEWYYSSSTDGQVTGAYFRIRNTKASAITWRTFFYFSGYWSWDEATSVALNGVSQWVYQSNCAVCSVNVDIAIPANRVSSVIFISTSGVPSSMRSNVLVFYNDCLRLPDGLEYVDDLEYATGGWEA